MWGVFVKSYSQKVMESDITNWGGRKEEKVL